MYCKKYWGSDVCKDSKFNKHEPLFRREKFKLLKVIGEEVIQVVSDSTDRLDFPAKDIIKVTFELGCTTDHAFKNKIVKQGIIHKKVLYCDTSGIVRCQIFDIPFTAPAEIPGVDPCLELEFQEKLILAETDYLMLDCQTVNAKVVFEIKIKVSTWVQEYLQVCNSNIVSHLQICR